MKLSSHVPLQVEQSALPHSVTTSRLIWRQLATLQFRGGAHIREKELLRMRPVLRPACNWTTFVMNFGLKKQLKTRLCDLAGHHNIFVLHVTGSRIQVRKADNYD